MLRVRYRTDGNAHALTLMGHANYDETGRDIVCAGASAIVYALLGWLENHDDDIEFINSNVEPGETWVTCEGGEKTATAFEMARIGLEQLATAYPDHVETDMPD